MSSRYTEDQRSIQAMKASVLLTEAARLCKIPIEVIAFDHVVFTLKKFEDSLTKDIEKKMARYIIEADGDNAIIKVYPVTKLPAQPRRHKFMFLITDGGEDDRRQAREVTDKFCKKHDITPYMIMIGNDDYQYIDPPFSSRMKDASGLVNNVAEAMGKIVKGQLKYK